MSDLLVWYDADAGEIIGDDTLASAIQRGCTVIYSNDSKSVTVDWGFGCVQTYRRARDGETLTLI